MRRHQDARPVPPHPGATQAAGRDPGDFDPNSNKIKLMTMKVSKGLGFPVVALPRVAHIPAAEEDEKEAARVSYVAATRVRRGW